MKMEAIYFSNPNTRQEDLERIGGKKRGATDKCLQGYLATVSAVMDQILGMHAGEGAAAGGKFVMAMVAGEGSSNRKNGRK